MADLYVRSDGSNTSPYDTWAKAATGLATALAAAAAGDMIYVADGHSENPSAAQNLTSPGTNDNPVNIICVDDTGDPEPPTARATGAVVSNTGNNAMTFVGTAYSYGIIYRRAGANSPAMQFGSGSSQWNWVIENGELDLATTSTSAKISTAPSNTNIEAELRLINTIVSFADTAQNFELGCLLRWEGGSFGGTIPTTVFGTPVRQAAARLVGVDLSAAGAGKTLFGLGTASPKVLMLDCKLNANVTIVGAAPSLGGAELVMVNCDSADTNYRFYRSIYQATEQQETTVVRTGGASDGTTAFARVVATSAGVTPFFAYQSMWMEVWNETTGSSVTVTVATITDGVTLTDAEAWLEVEYLGTSGFPLGVFATDRVSDPVFGTPANQPTDSGSTWGGSLSSPVKQSLSVTFTPQEKGIIRARVCVAKASTTVYYDPLLQVA